MKESGTGVLEKKASPLRFRRLASIHVPTIAGSHVTSDAMLIASLSVHRQCQHNTVLKSSLCHRHPSVANYQKKGKAKTIKFQDAVLKKPSARATVRVCKRRGDAPPPPVPLGCSKRRYIPHGCARCRLNGGLRLVNGNWIVVG